MKNINQYFNYLYTLERVGMKYDLRNITKLLKALGNPHKKFKSIHIAGTNGKGATASFTASILQESGCRTGLFTSPHLLKFNERIRINGKCISDSYIKKFLNDNIKLIEKVKPSFFEVNTALAFKYFAEQKVDMAVVECGLGGRLDSTNILTPEVCVITPIGIDHTQFLGKTLTKIAKEKAGILKHGSSVIISDTNKSLKALFRKKVSWQKKIFLDEFLNIRFEKHGFSLIFKPAKQKLNFTIPLQGKYQVRNAATALIAAIGFCKRTGRALHLTNVENGYKNVRENTGYRGRLDEIKSKGQAYVFDISHNPNGIKSALNELKPTAKDIIIFGIMADKDYKKAIKELLEHKANIIFTKPSYQRALEAETLYKTALRYKYNKRKLKYYSNIYEALSEAKEKAKGKIIIIGSFFLVHDAIKALKLEKHFS
jgi:dihydrofolate synthase / folylpolyglutamate synthase